MTEPFVKVSLDAIYAVVIETKQTLTEIVGHLDTTKSEVADHESRLRAVERRLWMMAGAGGLLGFIAELAFSVVTKK